MDNMLERILKSRKTQVFSVRIPAAIYLLYEALDTDKDDIAEIKQIISAYIVAKAIEKGIDVPEQIKAAFQNVYSKTKEGGNIVFNINISKSEARAAATNSVNIDLGKLVEKLNELERLLLVIQKNNWVSDKNAYILPPARMKELTAKLDELRRLMN